MNKKQALTYLMFERSVDAKVSNRYGATPIARSVAAWNMALSLCDNDESKIDTKLLDQIIYSINNGENVIEVLLNEDFEHLKG